MIWIIRDIVKENLPILSIWLNTIYYDCLSLSYNIVYIRINSELCTMAVLYQYVIIIKVLTRPCLSNFLYDNSWQF